MAITLNLILYAVPAPLVRMKKGRVQLQLMELLLNFVVQLGAYHRFYVRDENLK